MAEKKVYESRVEEYPAPTDYAWDMHLKREAGNKNVEITVCGSKGGLKARFHVRFADLDRAIAKIDPVVVGE